MLDVQGAVTGAGTDKISGASTLEFASSVAAGQTIAFAGSSGALFLGDPLGFLATIGGFDTVGADANDSLDLQGAWIVGQYTLNGAETGGTPALSSGSTQLTLGFAGNSQNGHFHGSAGAGNTTLVTYA